MVQFFERGPSRGALQSQIFGDAAKNIGGAVGSGMRRGQLQESIGEIGKLAENPETTSPQLLTQMMQKLVGIPGAEKYMAPMADLLNKSMLQQQQGKIPPIPGQEGQPQTKPTVFEEMRGKKDLNNPSTFLETVKSQIQDLPEPMQTPSIFHGDLEPGRLGMGPLPNTFSPEQIIQARTEDLQRGLQESPREQAMEKYNQLSRIEIQDYENAANMRSNVARQQRESQAALRDRLENEYGYKGERLSLAETIGSLPEFQNIANDQIKADRIDHKVKLVEKELNQFQNQTRSNPYLQNSRYNNELKNLHQQFQGLANQGLRGKALEALAKQGWTPSEISVISNPLGDTLKEIQTLPKFEKSDIGPQASKGESVQQKRSKEKIWEDRLPKIFRTGTVDPKNPNVVKPGTDLLLLRNEWLKANGNYTDFSTIINNLIQNGKIKLDPYQQAQLGKINEAPSKTLDVMEFLFGTTSR